MEEVAAKQPPRPLVRRDGHQAHTSPDLPARAPPSRVSDGTSNKSLMNTAFRR